MSDPQSTEAKAVAAKKDGQQHGSESGRRAKDAFSLSVFDARDVETGLDARALVNSAGGELGAMPGIHKKE